MPPGNLPDPGIKPKSAALQADSLPSETPGKSRRSIYFYINIGICRYTSLNVYILKEMGIPDHLTAS